MRLLKNMGGPALRRSGIAGSTSYAYASSMISQTRTALSASVQSVCIQSICALGTP